MRKTFLWSCLYGLPRWRLRLRVLAGDVTQSKCPNLNFSYETPPWWWLIALISNSYKKHVRLQIMIWSCEVLGSDHKANMPPGGWASDNNLTGSERKEFADPASFLKNSSICVLITAISFLSIPSPCFSEAASVTASTLPKLHGLRNFSSMAEGSPKCMPHAMLLTASVQLRASD